MNIPKKSLELLHVQAKNLVTAATSSDSWQSSRYYFVRFGNDATLREMRGYWNLYLTWKDDQNARIAMKKSGERLANMSVGTGVRSAGPFWHRALGPMSHAFKQYWKTGVVAGNGPDLKSLGIAGGHVNPMFAVSSAPTGGFAVHYGTDPLLGFPLQKAFEQVTGLQDTIVATKAAENAKTQFRSWCETFRQFLNKKQVCIRMFCCEALALCQSLQLAAIGREPGSDAAAFTYSKPWSSCLLSFDASSWSRREIYDVIDTSNLGDHVGLINILSAIAPLLHMNASSVAYTESLLMASETIETSLPTLLCSEITTFSFLIGLIPTGLLSAVTLEAVSHEAAMSAILQSDTKGQKQYRMRIAWKSPRFAQLDPSKAPVDATQQPSKVKFDAKALAGYLFHIYKRMFNHEDLSTLFTTISRLGKGQQFSTDQRRYTRAGMVGLLRSARVRIDADWNQVLSVFLSHIESDRSLLVGPNSLQELFMHLHMFGIWTSEALKTNPRDIKGLSPRSTSNDEGLLARKNIPPIVHVVLIVPREKLAIFTEKDPDEVGTPSLHVSIAQVESSHGFENHFHSFQCFFGSMEHNLVDGTASVLAEDENGWMGCKDLIVICQVPAFGLLVGPKSGIQVALKISTSPEATVKFSHLGPNLAIFETGLEDHQRCYVCLDAPGLSSTRSRGMQEQWIKLFSWEKAVTTWTLVKLDQEHKAKNIQYHVDFVKTSPESGALSAGAAVTAAVTSPTSVDLNIAGCLPRSIVYPIRIQGANHILRVARKSSWIEIECPISCSLDGDSFNSWTNLVFGSNHSPFCWSIPRVDLTIQSLIAFTKKSDLSWISLLMGSALSDSERTLNNRHIESGGPASSSNVKVDLKQSLNTLFASFAGLNEHSNQRPIKTFHLANLATKSTHTVILACNVFHDLDLGSIVMEAYVVPFNISRVMELQQALGRLQATTPCAIYLSNEEGMLWKRLLPPLAERCRTYKHNPACEYRRNGAPCSTREEESPLCTCGEGRVTTTELTRMGGSQWGPFAKYATRIAISPVFPVPYMEAIISSIEKEGGMKQEGSGQKEMTKPVGLKPDSERSGISVPGCDGCGKENDQLKACGRCGKVKYCGQACQKSAWSLHKRVCQKD